MSKKNVIIIVLDTLRKDFAEKHLNEDLQSLGFTYYSNLISTSSWTSPAHASLLTGLYPKDHGTHTYGNHPFDVVFKKKKLSLQHYFKIKGYETVLMSANPFITPNFGFNNFDKFVSLSLRELNLSDNEKSKLAEIKKRPYRFIANPRLVMKIIMRKIHSLINKYLYDYPLNKGISNLKVKFNKRAFTLINLMEVHEPYLGIDCKLESNFDENFNCNNLVLANAYKKHLLFLKKKLLPHLKRLIDENKSIILVLSDHGQKLCDDGWFGHGIFLTDDLVRVPMWLYVPKDVQLKRANKIEGWISLKSIFNLLFNYLVNGVVDENLLTSDYVFSEIYKFGGSLKSKAYRTEYGKRKYNKFIKRRVAVYYKNYKMTYNVDDEVVEELINYDGDGVPKGIQRKMLSLIKNFLNGKIH